MINCCKNISLILLFLGLISCDTNKVFEEYIEVENATWEKENIASFEFLAQDTTIAHNLHI